MNIELKYLIDKTERLISKIDWDEVLGVDERVSNSEIVEVLEECLEQLYRLEDLEK